MNCVPHFEAKLALLVIVANSNYFDIFKDYLPYDYAHVNLTSTQYRPRPSIAVATQNTLAGG